MEDRVLNLKISARNGLYGRVLIPPSKSYAHRILIASMLSERPTIIKGELIGNDIGATINCIKALGVRIEKLSSDSLIVHPYVRETGGAAIASIRENDSAYVNGRGDKDVVILDVQESGSTLRFLIPIVAALGVNSMFVGKGRIQDRPITELMDALVEKGVSFDSKKVPFTLSGKVNEGLIKIAGGVSSQYITGLLLAAPLIGGDVFIEILGDVVSKGYIDITLDVMKQFGVVVKEQNNGFFIGKGQAYISPGTVEVEGDWSSACFFAVGGAISGQVELLGMNPESKQGDRLILKLLERAGAKVEVEKDCIRITSKKLAGISFSAKDVPDIVPIMSILLANAKGLSEIKDVERLREKESDRLSAIIEVLHTLGIDAHNREDNLNIKGGTFSGGQVRGFNDHRMVMSAAISTVGTNNDVIVLGANAVEKSYPSFFSHFERLGGKVEII